MFGYRKKIKELETEVRKIIDFFDLKDSFSGSFFTPSPNSQLSQLERSYYSLKRRLVGYEDLKRKVEALMLAEGVEVQKVQEHYVVTKDGQEVGTLEQEEEEETS